MFKRFFHGYGVERFAFACMYGLFIGLAEWLIPNLWLSIIAAILAGYIVEQLIVKYMLRNRNSR